MGEKEGYSQLYEEALRVAVAAHLHQERKGNGLPYITHPVQVSVILLRHGFPLDVAAAGLLHDVVEDQGYELAQIEKMFGPRVAQIVNALTERKRDAQDLKRPWEVRKEEALEQMRRASLDAVAVKVADALHNVRCFIMDLQRDGPAIWQHFSRGPGPQLRHYGEILGIAQVRLGDHPLVAELADAIEDLAQVIGKTGWKREDLGRSAL